jgi:hypothetical protein
MEDLGEVLLRNFSSFFGLKFLYEYNYYTSLSNAHL